VQLQVTVLQPLLQLQRAQVLRHLLEQDLDEDAAAARGFRLVQVDVLQHAPGQRVRVQQVREQLGDVAQLVRLQPVDGAVVLGKRVVKLLHVRGVDVAEALGDEAVELEVRALLRAALDEHGAQLHLLPRPDLQLHQLVAALLNVQTVRDGQTNAGVQGLVARGTGVGEGPAHDGEVDGAPQVNLVRLSRVLNLLRVHLLIRLPLLLPPLLPPPLRRSLLLIL